MIKMLFALLLAAPPPAPELGPQPGEVREFGDWIVACDNGLACEAQSLEPADGLGEQTVSLYIQRAPGADGHFAIGVRSYEEIASDRIGLIVDGAHLGWADGEAGETFHFPAARAAEIAAALAVARAATLEAADGAPLGTISLAGSSAALRYIDDRQGRAGTVTAIAATGSAPASAVPAPPALPRIIAPASAASEETPFESDEVQGIRADNECFLGEDAPRAATAAALGGGVRLVLIECQGGAYNFSYLAFLERSGEWTPARFDAPVGWSEDGESDAPPSLVNAWWDAESSTLGEYAKGRGVGDCGTSQSFVWDGAMFRLVEKNEMPVCRGSPYWLGVYRATVARE